MKKDKYFILGMLSILLAIGLVFAGCDSNAGGDILSFPENLIGSWVGNLSQGEYTITFTALTLSIGPTGGDPRGIFTLIDRTGNSYNIQDQRGNDTFSITITLRDNTITISGAPENWDGMNRDWRR